jgi:starch phosphorylase
LTIGTLDGVNIEIREEVGKENFFLFGLTADEVRRAKRDGYEPSRFVEASSDLRAILDLLGSGCFSHNDAELFKPLRDALLYHDE